MISNNVQSRKRQSVEALEESTDNKRIMFTPSLNKLNTKTPIMLLQEICAKNSRQLPLYEEIIDAVPPEYADQNMKFFIECSALGLRSVGGGVTKKIAKHTSAEKLIHQLDGGEELETPSYNQSLESNAISELLDYCTIRNFHKPDFSCERIFGPTHDPSFTYVCRLDSVIGEATAGTKQLAKQLSAKKVLDVIKQGHPDSEKKLAKVNNQRSATEIAREKITCYRELKKRDLVGTMGTTIKDRHHFFRKQDPDFIAALREILYSTVLNEDERFTKLLTELGTMWQSQISNFVDTDLMQFELLIDCEVFTCLIVARKDRLQDEVIQYFKGMLGTPEAKPAAFDLSSEEFQLKTL